MNPQTDSPKAADIAYIRFQAPDLAAMKTFLEDFGFQVDIGINAEEVPTLFSRGTDPFPYCHVVEQGEAAFVGIGFMMESLEDLHALAAKEGASDIHSAEFPGGGKRVRFTDPQGYLVDGIFGWEAPESLVPEQRVPVNCGENRQRLDMPVRLEAGPAKIKRIGHSVLYVEDFRYSEQWYKERFGFVTSDELYVEEKSNVIGAFMRCDRGDIPVDHHTLFLLQSPDKRGAQHTAFEVNDWDDVMLGHDHMKSQSHTHSWGIGKHILGSEVFDYWLDPCGNTLEHFSDGDMFSAEVPPGLFPAEILVQTQWGGGPGS